MYKFFRDTHKWTGIILAVVILNISVTGFLLLIKKDFDWLQPPTRKGAAGDVSQFITTQQLFEIVLQQGHPDFQSVRDIDRVDFRPGERVHKVQSKHHYAEIQVDAVDGKVLGIATRRSDMIENLHDGTYFGEPIHGMLLPWVAVSLCFLTASGLFMWLQPKWRRYRRRVSRQE